MLMKKCLLASLILMLAILMLIQMLIYLNKGYADTDADLYFKIMALCCTNHWEFTIPYLLQVTQIKSPHVKFIWHIIWAVQVIFNWKFNCEIPVKILIWNSCEFRKKCCFHKNLTYFFTWNSHETYLVKFTLSSSKLSA